jgi:hypothetical protein
MIKLLDLLNEIEGDAEGVMDKVVKGFKLKPYEGNNFFGPKENVYTTIHNKPTKIIANNINNWIIKNFPNSKIRIKFDTYYNTLNFILSKYKDLGKDNTRLEDLDEINMKKIIGTAALAAGLAGAPNIAKAQDKIPTTQQDTAKTATATYTHPNQNTARSYATIKAKAALATKIGKPEGEISTYIVDSKMYQLKDGKYECIVTVALN